MAVGLLHFLTGLTTPAVSLSESFHWGISAAVPGLLWGYAYERTENLLVPAVMHAMSWTIPFSALVPFLYRLVDLRPNPPTQTAESTTENARTEPSRPTQESYSLVPWYAYAWRFECKMVVRRSRF